MQHRSSKYFPQFENQGINPVGVSSNTPISGAIGRSFVAVACTRCIAKDLEAKPHNAPGSTGASSFVFAQVLWN